VVAAAVVVNTAAAVVAAIVAVAAVAAIAAAIKLIIREISGRGSGELDSVLYILYTSNR
jgi:hypothetical protein